LLTLKPFLALLSQSFWGEIGKADPVGLGGATVDPLFAIKLFFVNCVSTIFL